MRISIIGAGNMGTAIACDLGKMNVVKLYTSKPELFNGTLKYVDMETGESFVSTLALYSNNYEAILKDAELVLIALPTMIIKSIVDKIVDYIPKSALVGFVPGAGGIEYLAKQILERGNVIFGFERVPYVSRLIDYGKTVSASKKKAYRIASLPSKESENVAEVISRLFERPCYPMKSFISMTLTPSLHVSRLYDLYHDSKLTDEYDENPLFYGEWRDSASYVCYDLDKELHEVCDGLTACGVDASETVPYPIHYESETPEKLTCKIHSIPSFKKITGPMVLNDKGKYVVDIESRYFTESFPYRLSIVKGLADLLHLKVPRTDEVLMWYANFANKEYYVDGEFVGKDVKECNIPQNCGINNIDTLRKFYQ